MNIILTRSKGMCRLRAGAGEQEEGQVVEWRRGWIIELVMGCIVIIAVGFVR